MFEDHISVLIERAYYTWENNNKDQRYSKVMISPEHLVDFEQLQQIHVSDPNDIRCLKRGEKGQRDVRPNPEKFLSSDNFELKFQAIITDINYGGDNYGHGGQWLGVEFMDERNDKLFTMKEFVDGIMAFIKDHELEKLNEVQHKL